jgi:hypothetical protein
VQQLQFLLLHHLLERRRTSSVQHLELMIVGGRFQPVLLRLIGQGVPRNAVHPGFKAVACQIRMPIPDHAQENFMDKIFRRRLSSRQPEKETEEVPMPALVNFAHARQIPARDGHHQFVIGLVHLRVPIGKTAGPQKGYIIPYTYSESWHGVIVESQGPSGVKYIVWGVLGIIAILVTVKQLGFTPTKISTGAVSVELSGGIAPAAAHPDSGQQSQPAEKPDTAQLQSRVHELENQLSARALPATPPLTDHPTPQQERPQRNSTPNISGSWRADPLSVSITQNGASVVMQVFAYGALASAGYGMIRGHYLQISYTNNLGMPGRMEATISPDADRMDVTDYGRGYPQSVVWFRNR